MEENTIETITSWLNSISNCGRGLTQRINQNEGNAKDKLDVTYYLWLAKMLEELPQDLAPSLSQETSPAKIARSMWFAYKYLNNILYYCFPTPPEHPKAIPWPKDITESHLDAIDKFATSLEREETNGLPPIYTPPQYSQPR